MGYLYISVVLVVCSIVGQSEATCSDPGAPDNGFVSSSDSFESGSKVRFGCEDDYELVGSPVSVCKDGMWLYPAPQCIRNCPALSAPADGEVVATVKFGMVAKFYCNEGFTMEGATRATCKGGEWSHLTPTCLANCEDPSFPENSERFTEGFDHGDSVRFVCDPGFHMEGSKTVTCDNGSWNHDAPSCVTDM